MCGSVGFGVSSVGFVSPNLVVIVIIGAIFAITMKGVGMDTKKDEQTAGRMGRIPQRELHRISRCTALNAYPIFFLSWQASIWYRFIREFLSKEPEIFALLLWDCWRKLENCCFSFALH